MEKRTKIKRVVLIGPESTGKSVLTKTLADYFNEPFVSEVAREYVEKLNRTYIYQDVETIAKMQIEAENKALKLSKEWLFIDTDLLITKVWFLHVYGKYPKWLDKAIIKAPRYLYLLCNFDLPWVADPVRENPDKREFFFNWYKREIELYKYDYVIINGQHENRLRNALKALIH